MPDSSTAHALYVFVLGADVERPLVVKGRGKGTSPKDEVKPLHVQMSFIALSGASDHFATELIIACFLL